MGRLLLLFGGAVVVLGACTTILGNDFEIVPPGAGANGGTGGEVGGSGATAMGGAGGSGGSGGSGGMAPPPVLSCAWELPEHEVAASLQGTTGESWSNLFGIRRDAQSARIATRHNTSGTDLIEVFTVSTNAPPESVTWVGQRYHQVFRLDSSTIGVLYSLPGTTGPELRLRVISDAGSSSGFDVVLEDAFPGISQTATYVDNALAVPIPDPQRVVDFVAGYIHTVDGFVEVYGRYDQGGGAANTVVITPAADTLGSGENIPTAMLHRDGTTYALLGNASTREYLLDGMGALGPPRSLAPVTGHVFFSGMGQDPLNANFGIMDDGPPVRLLVGAVAPEELGTFDPSQSFAEAFSVPTSGELYMGDSAQLVIGDLAAQVGGSLTNDTLMRYEFYGIDGADRGRGDLPFTAPLVAGEVRNFVDEVGFSPVEPDFDVAGGTLHVLWFESHTLAAQTFDVMYYDRLRCDPVP